MPETSNFAPTTAIVTGSDSGIGKATAVALAGAGMDVGVTWHSDKGGAEATAEELGTLPRVGPVLAQRIVDYRSAHGRFAAPEDLDAVSGIGPKMLEALLPLVTVR